MSIVTPGDVLEFWFGAEAYDGRQLAARMRAWFQGDPAHDALIRERFAGAIETAAQGGYADWEASARGALALILVLDQFPRHVHRGGAHAYAYDAGALAVCGRGLARGLDRELPALERQCFYLPLQHSEHMADQARGVALFGALADDVEAGSWLAPALQQALSIARVHAAIIQRYGRYPHRNRVLGRRSSLAERMFLDSGGPSFGQEPPTITRAPSAPSAALVPGRPPPMAAQFAMAHAQLSPDQTLCVDGRIAGLRCLSHWPGAPVPRELQHDLSTGMALAHARLGEHERRRVLGEFSVVTNDHYDCDGALAAFALLQPEASLRHAHRMLRAAACGDLRTFQGEDALAVDLSVGALMHARHSPLAAALAGESDYARRAAACYRWLLPRMASILAEPFGLQRLWQARFERVLSDIRAVERRADVAVERLPRLDLALVTSRRPLSRYGLVHAAGAQYRVLLVVPSRDGFRYRFLYRNESWFLGLRDRVPARRPLEPARARLDALERGPAGRWWCMPLDQTSPQLGFGDVARAADVFGDLRPELDPPSRLSPQQVVDALVAAFTADDQSVHSSATEAP